MDFENKLDLVSKPTILVCISYLGARQLDLRSEPFSTLRIWYEALEKKFEESFNSKSVKLFSKDWKQR